MHRNLENEPKIKITFPKKVTKNEVRNSANTHLPKNMAKMIHILP